MFTLVESKEEIATAQRSLEATIRRSLTKVVLKDIGYPGGTEFNASVHTDGRYWYWSADKRDRSTPNPRRLNWFGLFKEKGSLDISVEINTTYEGRNDQVAGFFARHSRSGVTYLLHSGRVGGGTKGVGKSRFFAWSNQTLTDVFDSSGSIREGVLVMPVAARGGFRSTARYVDAIAKFKEAVRTGEANSPEFRRKQKRWDEYYSEGRGRRKGKRSENIDYLSRHGDVVDALYAWRVSMPLPKQGHIVKDILIDMGVTTRDRLVEVFEVKSSADRSSIYSAVGQLMVHGAGTACLRSIVLPVNEPIAVDLVSALEKLGIRVLRFKLDVDKATIVC